MSLRNSYAAVLQLLRTQLGLSQEDLSGSVTQANVSSLELAKTSATVDTSQHIATAMNIGLPTLIAIVVASNEGRSARDVLMTSLAEVEALGMADTPLPTHPKPTVPPGVTEARKRWAAVQDLKAQGLSQSRAAKALGMPESTLRRLWHLEEYP